MIQLYKWIMLGACDLMIQLYKWRYHISIDVSKDSSHFSKIQTQKV